MGFDSTQVLINGSKLKLTAGAYQLVWGSVNPQELNNSEVVIACDATDGDVDVILPPTSQQQSNFATIAVGKIDNEKDKSVNIYPSGDDTMDGKLSVQLRGQYNSVFIKNLYGSDWTLTGNN